MGRKTGEVDKEFGRQLLAEMRGRHLSARALAKRAKGKGYLLSGPTIGDAIDGFVPGTDKLIAIGVGLSRTDENEMVPVVMEWAGRDPVSQQTNGVPDDLAQLWEALTRENRQTWLGLGDVLLRRQHDEQEGRAGEVRRPRAISG